MLAPVEPRWSRRARDNCLWSSSLRSPTHPRTTKLPSTYFAGAPPLAALARPSLLVAATSQEPARGERVNGGPRCPMLLLTRRPSEGVVIGESVRFTVLRVAGDRADFGLHCADSVRLGDTEDDRARFEAAWDRAAEASWDAVSGVWA